MLPAGLAALAALFLPLVIHLARRSERRPTDFAALQWLQARVRPRRNLRFDEWLLLALRLLLVSALALLLAKPAMLGAADTTPWVVAVPGVSAQALREADSGSSETEAERRWLAPGFPEILATTPSATVAVGSLLRELDAALPAGTSLTILVPKVLDGADAERPRLSRKVDWNVVPSTPAPTPNRTPRLKPMPILHVRNAEDRAGSLRYLRAATAAWQTQRRAPDGTGGTPEDTTATIEIAATSVPLPADAKLLAWLAPGPLPAAIRQWIEAGGIALLDAETHFPELDDALPLWRDADGAVLVRGRSIAKGRALRFTRPLAPAAIPALLEADFARQVRVLLVDPPPAPTRLPATAYTPTTGTKPWPDAPRDLSPWLALLIAALFLLERWFAASPSRRAST